MATASHTFAVASVGLQTMEQGPAQLKPLARLKLCTSHQPDSRQVAKLQLHEVYGLAMQPAAWQMGVMQQQVLVALQHSAW